MTLMLSRNGHVPIVQPVAELYLQDSVKSFFSSFNWSDRPPTLQPSNPEQPLSLTLSVRQFFAEISWEGEAIAWQNGGSASQNINTSTLPKSPSNPSKPFTLDDFSELF